MTDKSGTPEIATSSAPLTRRLVTGVLLVNLFVMFLAGLSIRQSLHQYETQAGIAGQNMALVLEKAISGVFKKIDIVLQATADEAEAELAAGSFNKQKLNRYIDIQRSRLPELDNLRISDSNGNVLYGINEVTESGKNIAGRDYFLNLRNNSEAGLYLAKPVIGIISGKWIMILARRITHPDGSFAGVVFGTIDLSLFPKMFTAIDVGRHGYITLRDLQFSLIARFPAEPGDYSFIGNNKVSQQWRDLLQRGQTVAGTYNTNPVFDSLVRTYSYRKFAEYPLYVNIGLATRDYLTKWRQEVAITIAATTLFLLVTLFISRLIYLDIIKRRRHEDEIHHLNRLYDILGQVNLLLIKARSSEELFQHSCDIAIERGGYLLAWIGRQDPRTLLVTPITQAGALQDYMHSQKIYSDERPNGLGLTSAAIREGRARICNDFQSDPSKEAHHQAAMLSGICSSIVIPFKLDEDSVGCFCVYASQVNMFQEKEVALLEDMAMNISVGLDHLARERKRELAERERTRLLSIIESAINEIFVFQPDDLKLEYANMSALDNLGYSAAQLYELTPMDLDPDLTEDKFRNLIAPLVSGKEEKIVFQTRFQRADASIYPVEVQLQIVPAGDEFRFLAMVNDITERNRLEEQLRQSLKMESIGRLAGGVAHDFNNKLSVILGYAEIAKLEVQEDMKLRQYLDEIVRAAEHSRDITGQLLAFSRQQLISPKPMDLNEALKDTQRSLPRLIGEDIELSFNFGVDLASVRIDPTQLDQIILNLAVNARDAMPNGGKLSISTSSMHIDEAYCLEYIEAKPGDYIQIAFSDTGKGMDKETLKHIFEPFFTTKGVGKGTGLGLATIYGIVTQNNGFINVYSEPGQGTVFKIFLPQLESSAAVEDKKIQTAPSGSGRILLVEDDDMVSRMTTTMLESIGYEIVALNSPADAIKLFRENRLSVDIILTDLIMPEMNGKEMMDAIHSIQPGIKVLYMSGYSSEIISQKGMIADDMNFIQKPFDMNTLYAKITEAIG